MVVLIVALAMHGGEWTTIKERIPFEAGWVFPATPPLEIAGGVATIGVKASDCGACHQQYYAEWRQSTHAHAMRDPQYFAELSKPSSPRWLCLNCHAPNQNQRSILITPQTRLRADPLDVSQIERVPNPEFDPAMRAEGVTCATCHVRVDGAGKSVVIASTKSGRAPHPVRGNPKALSTVCYRCHDPGPGTITPTFFCWFETAREGRARGVESNCVDCHMPPVTRGAVAGAPNRRTRHHYWAGGGVPKSFNGYDTLLARGYEPGGRLDARILGRELEVTLTNARAGHHLTSADPERHVVLVAEAVDAAGVRQVLGTRRFGQDWDWGSLAPPVRPAKRVDDTRIPAGQQRRWRVPLAPGVREIRVSAAHVRLTPDNARHMKQTQIPDEVRSLWPEAPGQIAELESHYPMMTWFDRLTWRDGSWSRTPLSKLLAESKAVQGQPLGAQRTLR